MKTCGNKTLDDFLQRLVKEFEEYNESFKENNLNIPFHISVLWQEFKNNNGKYNEFITYLNEYDYIFNLDTSSMYHIRMYVNFYKYVTDDLEEENIPITYEFNFDTDWRYWGYCECTQDDKDYKEDKGCCGHGCDWEAPNIDIYKREFINGVSWQGDEHDYWDFEDVFYLDDKEANERKIKKEKENKIKHLKETIGNAQKELKELENM